jgi:hypothetical protein
MSYIYANPNPNGRNVGDCTARAISLCEDLMWEEVYLSLCVIGFLEADMPSSNEVTDKYLLSQGYIKKPIINTCPDCYTARRFCEDHPKGRFILETGTHLICVIDGDIYDAWDSSDKVVVYYFAKEDDNGIQ